MENGLSLDLRTAARDAFLTSPEMVSARAAAAKNRESIREISEQFEGMFLAQMFGHMFKGIKTDGLLGGGNGEAIFRDMLVQEYGNQVLKFGGIGLADSIERQFLALQEVK
jgi:Rod binding domain-containing protein